MCAALLTGGLAAASLAPFAAGARTLEPDPSPAHWIAGGLKPDGFAPAATASDRIVATAPAFTPQPSHPAATPVQLDRPGATEAQPRQVVAAAPVSARRPVVRPAKHVPAPAHPARKRHAVTRRPSPPAVPFLAAIVNGIPLPSPIAVVAATIPVPARDRGPILPAGLAFLVLAAASGSFVSLAYRLHRERIGL